MKKALFLFLALSYYFQIFAQSNSTLGSISGVVVDEQTNEPLPFVNVMLHNDTGVINGAATDFNGKFKIQKIQEGNYNLKVKFIGYQPWEMKGVKVTSERITIVSIKMKSASVEMEAFEVVSYDVPLINMDNASSYTHYPSRRSSRKNNPLPVRGARKNANSYYYVDGLQVGNTNSESYDKIKDNKFESVKSNALSTFSIDVDRASYTNLRRYIMDGSLPPIDAVRIEEMINYFNYSYMQPKEEHPFSINTEYTTCPWNEKHNLVRIGIQGEKLQLDEAAANNLVFLIDVSGSMSSPDKLGLLKKGLYLLVDNLRDKDKVSIVVYAGAAGLVLEPTSGKHKAKIIDVIESLESGGSTAGGQGIELAYTIAQKHFIDKGNNRVILATDGDFNVGITDNDQLVKLIEEKRETGIFLSVLGFGRGNLQDSRMEKLADKGNGNYNYIDNLLEAKKVLVTELGGTLITIAKDVKIQAEFNPSLVKAYRLIGYENRHLDSEDFNDDTKDAGELGSGHTVTALYEIIPEGSKEKFGTVDSLKYQSTQTASNTTKYSDEIMTIKFRYKNPDENNSKLMIHVVQNEKLDFVSASTNTQFAAAVASFGMILRNSKFKGTSDYTSIIKMAKSAKVKDGEGYRAEFIRLVEMAELLSKEVTVR